MTPSSADLRCVHCGAAVSPTALADNWCEECGKRLPSTLRDAVQPEKSRVAIQVSSPEETNLARQRFICGGIIIALVGLLAFVFIPNLF
jgi:DNA-directed RNA polymerase subunit RPC12/RpoP